MHIYRSLSWFNWSSILYWNNLSVLSLFWSYLLPLYKDHQCRVNLCNLGTWRHASYASDQASINRLYLRRESSIILIPYFMQIIQDRSPEVFIEQAGFTVESISKDIIVRHCCALGFLPKCWAKWAAKEFKLLSHYTFWGTSWKCCSVLFKCILGVTNIESIATLACYFVAFLTFTSLCTYTVRFRGWIAVPFSIEIISRCWAFSDLTY